MNRLTAFGALGALGTLCAMVAATTQDRAIDTPAPSAATEPDHFGYCSEGVIGSAVFAPGTPWETVNKVTQALMGDPAQRYQLTGRWPGTAGTPVTVRYSFPPDGLNVPNGVGEGAAANSINAMFTTKFGSVANGKAKIRQCFDQWELHTGNVYVEVSDDGAALFGSVGPLHGGSGRGDIRIVAKPIDGSSGVLAYNFFPGITGGEMVLDSAEFWQSSTNDFRFFRNTVTHENGHGMGLLHVCPISASKLMEPFLNTNFDGPQHDDRRAMQAHYGDNYEPNGTILLAPSLGSFSNNGSATIDNPCNLRNTGDNDYFAFDLSNSGTATITVTPIGQIYNQGPQTNPCGPGSADNSLQQLGLRIQLIDTDGTTVLTTADATGLGGAEGIVSFPIPTAGEYFFLIDETATGGLANSQMYNLTLSVTVDPPPPACPGDLNGDLQVDAADLGLLIAAYGNIGIGLPADLNGDGQVDAADLGLLIAAYGDICI